ncbi:hypothetical protein DERP_011180 [Dermatophagoides pteronyssinus]|uniref:Uncharacterized protein n=1 Tax=Dermatophagoides pteronyssinus TaxID=6956 RepID=A0ABQ8JCX0_DERPT|nr:hypothetical protein DERP_011180 [Dermatophagoides pteronyssinus]
MKNNQSFNNSDIFSRSIWPKLLKFSIKHQSILMVKHQSNENISDGKQTNTFYIPNANDGDEQNPQKS